MPQYQFFVSDKKINANICSFNAKQRQVFDFIQSWAKETVKQKGSVEPNVEKFRLIKAIYQSIAKVLQYHNNSQDKPRILFLEPTGVAVIDINGIKIHLELGIPCRRRLDP